MNKETSGKLRVYDAGRSVPADAKKQIGAGRLKGMTDVNPMWRIKRLTEIFGPCGIGWRYTIDKFWTETYGQEVKCFCIVSLWVKDPDDGCWSDAIPGVGGSSIVQVERNGVYVNDEGYKMALTDALSIAMKALGIGADVWYGEKATGHNESKYEQYTNPAAPKATAQPAAPDVFAQLRQASTRDQLMSLWKAYAAMHTNPEVSRAFSARKKELGL